MRYIPIITEQTPNGEKRNDIISRLLEDRIILIHGIIDDEISSLVIAQLLLLESKNNCKDIYIYINSPGGQITSGLAIYDTIQYIKPQVTTICVGQACSMGAFLLASGTPNKRFALPNVRIMIHQPIGGFKGQATDIKIHAKEIIELKNTINLLLAKHTNNSLRKVKKDTERDLFMNAESALKYGIIDNVLTKRK